MQVACNDIFLPKRATLHSAENVNATWIVKLFKCSSVWIFHPDHRQSRKYLNQTDRQSRRHWETKDKNHREGGVKLRVAVCWKQWHEIYFILLSWTKAQWAFTSTHYFNNRFTLLFSSVWLLLTGLWLLARLKRDILSTIGYTICYK